MSTSFLTSAVLEETHTARNYLLWASGLVEKVKSEPDGLERIRLRIGLVKELMDEAIPIGLLASKYFGESEEVRVSLKIGNQTFDATVMDDRSGGSGVAYIEVTMAHEGDDEHLRMKVMHETGESGFGKVIKGTKKTGWKAKIDRGMISQADILKREADLITKAIDRKLGKPYPPNTLLLISFDDRMAFDRHDNIENLETVVSEYLPKLKAFHTVAIVGRYQDLFLCRRTDE